MTQTNASGQDQRNPIAEILEGLLGKRNAIVFVVDEQRRLLDYEVQPLAEVVATLDINGFGEPFDIEESS